MNLTKLIVGGLDMWGNLMATQDLLDRKIKKDHSIEFENVLRERYMATLDELMEYAKETKCFKYWSLKKASRKAVRLEEFIDGIHFYLSKANEFHLNPHDLVQAWENSSEIATYRDYKKGDKKGRITTHVSSAIMYLTEMLKAELAYSYRKNDTVHIDIRNEQDSNRKMYLISSFEYFLAAGRIDGFTDADIERAYYLKNAENLRRQKTGY